MVLSGKQWPSWRHPDPEVAAEGEGSLIYEILQPQLSPCGRSAVGMTFWLQNDAVGGVLSLTHYCV